MHEVGRMNTQNYAVLRLVWLTALALSQFVGNVHPLEAQTQGVHTWQTLDRKAETTKSDDQEAVKSLTDEVFAQFKWANRREVKERVAEKIKNAEVRHRQYKDNVITDTDVVRAVNKLAERLNAPSYAKTTIQQVRALRAAMAFSLPHFISSDPDRKNIASSRMTPLEAVFVTLSMLEQKMYNPEYQRNAHEWKEALIQKSEDVSRAHRTNAPPSTQSKSKQSVSLKLMASPRSRELQDAIARALTADPTLLSGLPDAVLHDLGNF